MDRPTARRLARALIAPATQHIPDEHLEATLDLAEHLYRARAGTLTYLSAVAQRDDAGTDDTGDYTDIRLVGLARELADPRTILTIAGSQPRWKLRNATPTLAYVRVYAPVEDGAAVTLWRAETIYHPSATVIVALLAASFYIHALCVAEGNAYRADTLADLAHALYARATDLIERIEKNA